MLWAELNDTTDGRYIVVIRCDAGGTVCCMMWNVRGLECEVVQNGVVKKSVWCEMVA